MKIKRDGVTCALRAFYLWLGVTVVAFDFFVTSVFRLGVTRVTGVTYSSSVRFLCYLSVTLVQICTSGKPGSEARWGPG